MSITFVLFHFFFYFNNNLPLVFKLRPNLSLCSQASSFYDRFFDMDIFVHYGPK